MKLECYVRKSRKKSEKIKWDPSMRTIDLSIVQLQWELSNSIIVFPSKCKPSVGSVLHYWEILVKSFFQKSVVESREKFKSILKYFFHLIVSLFFSKWGLFLGVWISVCLFVFVPLKNREINNSMPKYKLQLLHPISSDFINPAIPKSDNSAFLDE